MTAPGTTDPEHDLRAPSAEDGAAGDVRIPEPQSASESEETEDADFSSATGGRLTREELESKYRQDPRFTMLFDHGKPMAVEEKEAAQRQQRRYVRVGGIRLTPKRIVIIAGFLLIMLGCVGACFFFLVKELDRSIECSRAIALYDAGDYAAAKEKLIEVLSHDPHKEAAVAALADIYHKYGDWGNETFFRQRLARLNPLNQQYYEDYLDSAMRARNYSVIYSLLSLKAMDEDSLDPETASLYLLSALHSDHVSNGKSFYRSKTLTEPRFFSSSERGRLAEVILKAELLTPKDAEKLFATLDDVKDPVVRFEVQNMRAYLLSKFDVEENDAKIEALLKEAAELNNFAGAPILANYYFTHYQFEDAMRVSEEFLQNKLNTVMPIIYGESCVLSGQPELIDPLADRIRNLGGRQSRIIASYLDALKAFAEGDMEKTKTCLLGAANTIATPLSSLMTLLVAVYNRSSTEVRSTLDHIMMQPPFMDFQERARSAALHYLLTEVGDLKGFPDQQKITEYAAIADLIRTPGDDSSFLLRIILLDKYNRGSLNEDELQSTLKTFPNDPVLLRIAAEYYLFRNNTKLAMEYIDQARKGADGAAPDAMDVLHMLALDQQGRHEEAGDEFRSIVERAPDNGDLLFYYYTYCTQHGFQDSLRELGKRVAALPQNSGIREFLPFIQAEIQFADGDKTAALDVFENAKTDRPDLIDYAGDFLAAGGRTDAAIKRYLSILENEDAPDKAQLNLKLSRLYREKNDLASARKYAYAAWSQDREDLDARFAYAHFLVDEKDYAEALSVLKFPQYKASFPEDVVALWETAMRAQIRSDFLNGRYTPAFEGAKQLQVYFPYDEMAQDYIQRVEQIRQEEREKEKERQARSKKKPAAE